MWGYVLIAALGLFFLIPTEIRVTISDPAIVWTEKDTSPPPAKPAETAPLPDGTFLG